MNQNNARANDRYNLLRTTLYSIEGKIKGFKNLLSKHQPDFDRLVHLYGELSTLMNVINRQYQIEIDANNEFVTGRSGARFRIRMEQLFNSFNELDEDWTLAYTEWLASQNINNNEIEEEESDLNHMNNNHFDIDNGEVPDNNNEDVVQHQPQHPIIRYGPNLPPRIERINNLFSQQFHLNLHRVDEIARAIDLYLKNRSLSLSPTSADGEVEGTIDDIIQMRREINDVQILKALGINIFTNIYNFRTRGQEEKLLLLLKIWSMSQMNFNYIWDDNLLNLRCFVFNLLYKLMVIPLSLRNEAKYICEIEYFSVVDEEERTKTWYVHMYTINYLLKTIFRFIRSGVSIEYNATEESSDFEILLSNVERLRALRLITQEYNRDGVELPRSVNFMEYRINGVSINDIMMNRALTPAVLTRILDDLTRQFVQIYNNLEVIRSRRGHPTGFFPYFHQTNLDLSRYQIARSREDFIAHNSDIYSVNCFIYALSLTGIFTPAQIEEIKTMCYSRVISIRKLMDMAEIHKIRIVLHKWTEREKTGVKFFRKYVLGDGDYTINLVLIHTHVMIQEFTPYKKSDIIPGYNDKGRYLKTSQLIRFLEKHNKFVPIRLSDVIGLDLTYYHDVKKDHYFNYIGDIDFTEDLGLKKLDHMYAQDITFNARVSAAREYLFNSTSPEQYLKFYKNSNYLSKIELTPLLFYADFETFTVDNKQRHLEYHKPFMCCITHDETNEVHTFDGENCGEEMLRFIFQQIKIAFPKRYPIVYIHNLGYDIHFFAKYGIISSISKGHRMLTTEVNFNGLIITFKDSYSIIPVKLDKFGQIFGMEQEKEIFPYDYYTEKRYYTQQTALWCEIIDYMGDRWSNDEKNHFTDNCLKVYKVTHNIPLDKEIEDEELLMSLVVNLRDYAEFYCKQDVVVLRDGLRIFTETLIKDFGLKSSDFLSISSLAAGIFHDQVYSQNDNLYLVGGIVREFMSYAIHGGRVMTNSNKKWYFNGKKTGTVLVDFDAVSLYPSAVHRLYLVEGKPQPFNQDELTADNLLHNPKYTAYVVEIIVTAVKRPRQFPLIPHYDMDKKHIVYSNESDIRVFTCDIELKDMVEFQEIEFVPIRGYYWTGKKDFKVQEVIQAIFNKRLEYKDQKNPLQNVYKLILNSVYGKTIIKPHVKNVSYFKNGSEEYHKFISKNCQDIIQMNRLRDSDIVSIEHLKPIHKHFNLSLFGIHILAMSKRIMNEVMCLAEDLGIMIYYQDTDSMHIEKHRLTELNEKFKEKYGRELIGGQLGQFHSDFDLNESKDVWSDKAYFLGKKAYIDHIHNIEGDDGYHIRLKGVPNDSIKYLARTKKKYKGKVMNIYKALYNEKEIVFDLLANYNPKFEYGKDMTITSKDSFLRKVKFK